MKKLFIYFFIVLVSSMINKSFAQTTIPAKDTIDDEKSMTKSYLCEAQGEILKMIMEKAFLNDAKVDVKKTYKEAITKRIAECMAKDLQRWGNQVIQDITDGKIKNRGIKFEKPDDNTWPVPIKAQKKYLKGFDKAKEDFFSKRKTKTLTQVLDQKNIKRYITKTAKVYIKKNNKQIKKLTKKTRFRWLRSEVFGTYYEINYCYADPNYDVYEIVYYRL